MRLESELWRLVRDCLPLVLLLSQQAIGQEPDVRTDKEINIPAAAVPVENQSDVDSGDVIDEITVYAPRSLLSIQRAIYKADDHLYALFNASNDDKKYDVHCNFEKRQNSNNASNIKVYVCKPQFEREINRTIWRDAVRGDEPDAGQFRIPQGEIQRQRAILKEKILMFAAENPALAKAIIRRAELQLAYEEERKRRRE